MEVPALMATVSETLGCKGCPLRAKFPNNNFVPPQQIAGSTRLLVGEAPGQEESETLIPFSGGAGRWLNAMLAKAGLRREKLSVANTIQCRPPENVYPTDSEAKSYITFEQGEKAVHHCIKNHLLPILESKQWDRVDLLGEKALRYLTGKGEGIYKWRGSPIEIDTEEVRGRVE